MSRPIHPGRIVFVDVVNQSQQERLASEVPNKIAFAERGGEQVPVVRIEIYRTPSMTSMTAYDASGALLTSTTEAS